MDWLLKNYWNPDSPLLNPLEQQTSPVLTRGVHPFAIITMMSGSERSQPQGQLSKSSGKQALQTTTCPKAYFTHLLYPDPGDGAPYTTLTYFRFKLFYLSLLWRLSIPTIFPLIR
ncbi:hypothetical protein [Endozoicomonas sp. 8E]|uniref:hypothetical protein n=1 Tax=Endozoicomonas sp. 8E TaxID=3035692 RepID=UPI002939191B|nr:hypothetical protein [Endozoicomonas sp. 8E]WOG26938.1 hypothetical protein P6910_20670 [Endozoicomonas sp. 8E]